MITKVEVSLETVSSLLCSAFEGGSNYWYNIESSKAPSQYKYRSDPKHIYSYLDFPINPGGRLVISSTEDGKELPEKFILNLAKIKNGLRIMAKDHPKHFADVISDNHDAITGDVFLQCCLFEKVIYG